MSRKFSERKACDEKYIRYLLPTMTDGRTYTYEKVLLCNSRERKREAL